MPQPGAPSRVVLAILWMVVGTAMVAVPAWLGWTRWRTLLDGNPTLLAAAIFCAAGGVVALAWSVASLFVGARHDREQRLDRGFDPEHSARRTPAQLRRRAKWRIGLAVPALVACIGVVSVLAWARPFPATDTAVAATQGNDAVAFTDLLTWYELSPVRTTNEGKPVKATTTGLVFSPGARVDSRAYAKVLRPLAEAGFLVVVLKEPLGIALADANHAARVFDVHPEIRNWAVGGHSLGGVAAASFADSHGPRVKGLLLYASYPQQKLTRTDLRVLSVSGDADGLATPADIAASKAKLPRATTFVAVKGGVHAYFGDYGTQPGDGTPTVDRGKAQAQITQATRALLVAISAPPPKKK